MRKMETAEMCFLRTATGYRMIDEGVREELRTICIDKIIGTMKKVRKYGKNGHDHDADDDLKINFQFICPIYCK
jgi:hypothetical protein